MNLLHIFSCKKLEYRYDCNEGTWTKADQAMDDGLEGNVIKEIECHADDLQKVPLEEDGRDITCKNGGLKGDGTIPSENVCLMICDGYAALSFYTDWKEGAEGRGWFYALSGTQSEPTPMSDGTVINCWGR